jgi:hypothetical protein
MLCCLYYANANANTNYIAANPVYPHRMVGFESDCNDGKGDGLGCHHAAEYFAAIKDEYERAALLFSQNCEEKKFYPSCFTLARAFCKQSIVSVSVSDCLCLVTFYLFLTQHLFQCLCSAELFIYIYIYIS